MGNRRAPLTEADLRRTKDDLLERVTKQKRLGGVPGEPGLESDPTGGVTDAEEWLDPILRKTEINHERARDKDLVRVDEDLEPRHVDTKESIGAYEWNLRTDKVTPRDGSVAIPVDDLQSMVSRLIGLAFKVSGDESMRATMEPRSLKILDDLRVALMGAQKLCLLHYRPNKFCAGCGRREELIRKFVAAGIYGLRRHKKITVS